jgi:endonuclease/exonuclease/phosphatase family metal-dependent hydrolase
MKHYIYVLAAVVLLAASCEKQPAILKAATYNLRLDTQEDSINAWKYRKENVKALLEYHNFDLLATQEGYISQLLNLCELADYEYVGVGRDDGRKAGEHSAIIYKTSRLELLDAGDFWLSPTPDKPSKGWDAVCCNRICSWARLRDKQSGRTFFAFNAHFDHQGNTARMESAKLMLTMISNIAGNAPVVCMGDFNSEENTPQIKTMLSKLSDARSTSSMPPYGPIGTFNTRFQNPVGQRIDYIFVNDKVKVLRYAVLSDNNGQYYPSDHLPVSASLIIE